MRAKLTTKEVVNRAKEVHGDLYCYDKMIYNGFHEEMEIICKIHEVFFQTYYSHVFCKRICPECKSTKGTPRTTLQEFIERANKKHKFKYNYSKVNFRTLDDIITIICPIHKEFEQCAKRHLTYGCNDCAIEYRKLTTRKSQDNFITEAIVKHNNKYTYELVDYLGTNTKVTITCPDHGHFKQTPHSHLFGSGCPNCIRKISKSEINWLNSFNIELNRYYYISIDGRRFFADGFDPVTNTIYEFYGDYYHGNPNKYPANKINKKIGLTHGELYQRTMKREQILKNAGYNLIVIWEQDYNKLIKASKIKT